MHALSDDEAIAGTGSLAILQGDFFLHHERVMKPFMVYYIQAASRAVFGNHELAGRLPGILATLCCIWLIFRIGRRWFDEWTGLIAAGCLAFSPFVLQHFPNARTDALAVAFVLGSIELAGRGKTAWAGFVFALAFCTRQLSIINLPLVLAFMVLDGPAKNPPEKMTNHFFQSGWRFCKGALLPGIVLLAWSAFTDTPFAWLIQEFKGGKYSDGPQNIIPFPDKLGYWIKESLTFLGWQPLSALALALVLGLTIVLLVRQVRQARRLRKGGASAALQNRPDLAVLLIVGVFLFLFYAVHSLRSFVMYERYLAPATPWVALIFAACVMFATRWIVGRRRGWRRLWLALLVVGLAAAWLGPAVQFLREQQAPRPEDDIPPIITWIKNNAAPGAVFISSGHGAESRYYAWRKPIEIKHFGRRLEKLKQIVVEKVEDDLFLYLNQRDLQRWGGLQASMLPNGFQFERAAPEITRAGVLYRIKPQDVIGYRDGVVTYIDSAALVQRQLDCAWLEILLNQAFVCGTERKAGIHFVYDAKDFPWWRPSHEEWLALLPRLDASPIDAKAMQNILAFKRLPLLISDAGFCGLPVWSANLDYLQPEWDWPRLLTSHKLKIRRAAAAQARFSMAAADLAQFAGRRNPELEGVRIGMADNELTISAVVDLKVWRPNITISGPVYLQGEKLMLTLKQAKVNGWPAPAWLRRLAEERLNPLAKINLQDLALRPTRVWLEDETVSVDHGTLFIEAELDNRAPSSP